MYARPTRVSLALACLGGILIAAGLAGCHYERPESSLEAAGGQGRAAAGQPDGVGKEIVGTDLTIRVFLNPLPDKMPGSENDTPEMAALGRDLFFERGMSLGNSQSCNDCHQLDGAQSGADTQATSKGAKGEFGKRNSPTVLNAGFHLAQFWDGRAADLVEQAKGPIMNPVEMAMSTPQDVESRLKSNPDYPAKFAKAFPGEADPVTFDNVARAIAAFERTLVAPAPIDRYLKGDKAALNAGEEAGLRLFVETGCIECHNGPAIGGQFFEVVGVHNPYGNRDDLGRFEVTKKESDRYVFKVPSLRNITRTAPYFHDGQAATLDEAVRLMGWMQLGLALDPSERVEIVTFLRALESEKLPAGGSE